MSILFTYKKKIKNNMKSKIVRSVLNVKKKEHLAPHYIRVTLTGEDVKLFENITVGKNNKIFLPPAGSDKVYFPILDQTTGQMEDVPDELKPIRRTYTHRGIDLKENEMYIDFVAHGDNGPASAWAIQAKPGDQLGVAMKDHPAPLHPQADWYLLACDATGIPVIASILEALPATAQGEAYIEVLGKEEEIPLSTKADIQIHWIHNPHPGQEPVLAKTVRQVQLPDHTKTSVFGYIAAEFSSIKDLRIFLRKEVGLPQESLYAYSYWKYGKSEDGSVAERQEEKKSLSYTL